jgi:two-component system, sporulation sensor kinase A
MERISRSTERLETFTRSILDFSNSANPMGITPVDLVKVLKACIALHFRDKLKSIHISSCDDMPPTIGERYKLEQVFLSFLKNAFEAQANQVEVKFAVEVGGRFLRVTMEDDGLGCTEEQLQQLGTPFFTTKRQTGGTGLGIAIAGSIVRNHGGSLHLAHRAGPFPERRGLVITMVFHAYPADDESILARSGQEQGMLTKENGK